MRKQKEKAVSDYICDSKFISAQETPNYKFKMKAHKGEVSASNLEKKQEGMSGKLQSKLRIGLHQIND